MGVSFFSASWSPSLQARRSVVISFPVESNRCIPWIVIISPRPGMIRIRRLLRLFPMKAEKGRHKNENSIFDGCERFVCGACDGTDAKLYIDRLRPGGQHVQPGQPSQQE